MTTLPPREIPGAVPVGIHAGTRNGRAPSALHQASIGLEERLASRQAKVVVVGLGYAGLPMAVACAEAGYPVVGLDVDTARVDAIQRGVSPVSDVVTTATLAPLLASGALRATTATGALRAADVVVVCVPTPLTAERLPDLRAVRQVVTSLTEHARPGQLVILQSTCGPGTTRQEVGEPLAARGLRVGHDIHVAYAPERIDPGNSSYTVRNTPKLVGGLTPRCTALTARFFACIVDDVVECASPEVAELSKMLENTFRFVNISLVNEFARLCDRLGVNVWDVLDAAATKPFAYLPHRPSAGVGGHCIPVVPFYLADVARQVGTGAELVDAAARVNASQPVWVVDKLARLLAERGQPLRDAHILLLGVTYKPDVADLRESAALAVLAELIERGARVAYHDPWVPTLYVAGRRWCSVPLTALDQYDAAVLLTAHQGVDYARLAATVPLLFDTSNTLAALDAPHVVPL